jgi:transposase
MENKSKKSKKGFYGASMKRQVVREYESGYYSKTALLLKYGILSCSTLTSWCKKYGTLAGEKEKIETSPMKRAKRKESQEEVPAEKSKRSTDQLRISELEKEVETMRLRAALYLKIIEISSEQIGEDLLKKTGIGLLNPPEGTAG